jgi:hypothetical protein
VTLWLISGGIWRRTARRSQGCSDGRLAHGCKNLAGPLSMPWHADQHLGNIEFCHRLRDMENAAHTSIHGPISNLRRSTRLVSTIRPSSTWNPKGLAIN